MQLWFDGDVPPLDPSLTPPELVEIIRSLYATIESLRKDLERRQADAEEARREVRRLVAMVESLTRQLDALLRDRDEERREELARIREEAAKIAAAAAAAASEPPAPDASETPGPDASGNNQPEGREAPSPEPATSRRSKHGRGQIPPELPRDDKPMGAAPGCKCGSTKVKKRDTEVTEEWDYVRGHLRVRRTTRVVGECDDCGARVVLPQPPMPFDRAACTFAMIAFLWYARCALFLTLDRVQRDFVSQGARIPSPTLTRWSNRGADLLLPIAACVRLALLGRTHIRTDGTGLTVVFPRVKGAPVKGPERPGETDANGYLPHRGPENGQILVFGSDHEAVYHYTPTKHGRHFSDFLTLGKDEQGTPIIWRGTITADAASVLDAMFNDFGCTESGCNAHGLRKFRDDADKAPLLAGRAMGFIGRVYDIEAEARAKELHGPELLAHRKLHAGPVVEEFRTWISAHITDLLPKNPVRKAMQYYVNHWDALTRFLYDPDVPLDNNWSENALRKVATLRKNSLFAGGQEGAIRLCTIFTLIHTARLVGVDPYDYLEWALTRVVPHPDNRKYRPEDLTPAAYAAFLGKQ